MGWTCPGCGIDYDTLAPSDLAVAIRSYPRRFRSLLTTFDAQEDDDALIRRKPDATTWSALTYTSHVADVLAFHADAIRRMLDVDDPTIAYPSGGDDATEQRAAASDRDGVLDRLGREAERLASVLGDVKGDAWNREGEFPWGRRDLLVTARNAVHEGHHHLRDVEHALTAVRGKPTRAE
jgi:hypothetical protein